MNEEFHPEANITEEMLQGFRIAQKTVPYMYKIGIPDNIKQKGS